MMTVRSNKKRANLRDVASLAKVSVATVSRVLNAPSTVSTNTRARVQQAIDSLHFVPSAAARAINSGRTRMVGALVPTLDHAIFTRFLASLENRLSQHGLSLIVATTDNDQQTEAQKAQALVDIGAEALIVSGINHSEQFDTLIRRTRLPAIATSFHDDNYYLPTIGYDNAAAARLALDYLYNAGHRQLVVIHGPLDNNDRTRARLTGLESAPDDVALHFIETDISISGGAAAITQFIDLAIPCSALLCLSDVLAMGALFELQRQGIDVPRDVSLMGLDDLPSSAVTMPEISSVHLPVGRMGEHAANAVVEWIEQQRVPDSLLLDSSLVPRNSTRCIE